MKDYSFLILLTIGAFISGTMAFIHSLVGKSKELVKIFGILYIIFQSLTLLFIGVPSWIADKIENKKLKKTK